jgi:hypothetical protein
MKQGKISLAWLQGKYERMFSLILVIFIFSCQKMQQEPNVVPSSLQTTTAKAKLRPIDKQLVADGFVSPIGLVAFPDQTGRLAVIDQVGKIWIIDG